jgi:hypothetical protein
MSDFKDTHDGDKKKGRPSDAQRDQHLLKRLKEYWDNSESFYAKEFRKIKILDMTDRGELWRAIGTKYPKYQILPDTNHVASTKTNIIASIYCVTKSAEVIPTNDKDKDLITNLNVILDAVWDTQDVGFYQFQAGERAALGNLGITQVGWDEELTMGSGENIIKGNVHFKNIDPLKFKRDPYAVDLASSAWCCTYEDFHKTVFLNNKLYKEKFKEYLMSHHDGDVQPTVVTSSPDGVPKSGAKDYYSLVIYWYKDAEGDIKEVHTINTEFILLQKERLKPAKYPFALLYCNLPAGALIGTSECSKIFANNVAYNLMDSIALTSEYKNQRPPKFISDQSKLNIQAFAKYGDEADRTWVVSGDASKAVQYHEFPQPSNFLTTLKMSLEQGIATVTGIDRRYTGRDTGSITTTGGTEEMLTRVTMIDNPKITMYEHYCKELTELVLRNLLEFCPKRKFFVQKKNSREWETYEVDFPKIESETLFNYRIAISSELPKNKQRIAAMATELLKNQEQYRRNGDTVNWITEEEWLMFQDLPFKELMLERMGVQRQENVLEQTAQVLYQYANMINNGADSDTAMMAAAESLKQSRLGNSPEMAVGANPQLQAQATPSSPQGMPMKPGMMQPPNTPAV